MYSSHPRNVRKTNQSREKQLTKLTCLVVRRARRRRDKANEQLRPQKDLGLRPGKAEIFSD